MCTSCCAVHTNPADPRFQRNLYNRGFYRRMRRIRWLLRYDCRYRMFLMEEAFHKHRIPFEHQKVYELGFGAGDLLLRFDNTCILHGCEVSAEAINQLYNDRRIERYREARFVLADSDGYPVFPSSGYDLIIASHVLEHVPDDKRVVKLLAEKLHPDGLGLFFVPLERPSNLSYHHVHTYTAAGFTELLCSNGWQPVQVSENLRCDSHSERFLQFLDRLRLKLALSACEAARNAVYSLVPSGIMHIVEGPLASLYVPPRQLMVLARRRP